MEKISFDGGNAFCPQALYLYGTYKDDGNANYGLFCWCAYCNGGALKFVACIGEDKLTRDLIRKNGVFSATVVTEELLSAADFCGTHSGYAVNKEEKIPSVQGEKLNVPVPTAGSWTMELRVEKVLRVSDEHDSDIYICDIVNVVADRRLLDETLTLEEKLVLIKPVVTMKQEYLPVAPQSFGGWGTLS